MIYQIWDLNSVSGVNFGLLFQKGRRTLIREKLGLMLFVHFQVPYSPSNHLLLDHVIFSLIVDFVTRNCFKLRDYVLILHLGFRCVSHLISVLFEVQKTI